MWRRKQKIRLAVATIILFMKSCLNLVLNWMGRNENEKKEREAEGENLLKCFNLRIFFIFKVFAFLFASFHLLFLSARWLMHVCKCSYSRLCVCRAHLMQFTAENAMNFPASKCITIYEFFGFYKIQERKRAGAKGHGCFFCVNLNGEAKYRHFFGKQWYIWNLWTLFLCSNALSWWRYIKCF